MMEPIRILDRITDKTSPQDVVKIINEYKLAAEQKKLWRSPFGTKWFTSIVLMMLLLTILKVCSPGVWVHIPANFLSSKIEFAKCDLIDFILYAGWIIGPPVSFLIEYIFLFGKDPQNRMDLVQFTDIKYCHELATKVWAGVGVLLTMVLVLKYGLRF